jgi:hypothetical protein
LSQSLCNACGIRYRKKRREALGLDASKADQQKARKKPKREKEQRGEEAGDLRSVGFGKDVVLKRRRRRRRLGEEERAAFLLMALSSGVVYA